jgi:hypothetical protein
MIRVAKGNEVTAIDIVFSSCRSLVYAYMFLVNNYFHYVSDILLAKRKKPFKKAAENWEFANCDAMVFRCLAACNLERFVKSKNGN